MEFLTNIWWVRLPRIFRRIAATPAAVFSDGLYISAFPPAAAFLSPAVFVSGFLFGLLHLLMHWATLPVVNSFLDVGRYLKFVDTSSQDRLLSLSYETVFSESLPFLLIAVFIGVLSGHLGAMLLSGFALGDVLSNFSVLLSGQRSANVGGPFSFVIEFALLGLLTTQVPLITKALLSQFYFILRLGKNVSFAALILGHVLLSVLLVFLWGQAVPMLLRPVVQDYQAAILLQHFILPLLLSAALASTLRMTFQGLVAFSPSLSERVTANRDELIRGDIKPITEKLPGVVRAFSSGAWGGFLLLGLSDNDDSWAKPIIAGGIIFALQLLRFRVVTMPLLDTWAQWTAKVPLLIRLAIGTLALLGTAKIILNPYYGLSDMGWLSKTFLGASASFTPMWFLVMVGLIMFFILNPGMPIEKKENTP